MDLDLTSAKDIVSTIETNADKRKEFVDRGKKIYKIYQFESESLNVAYNVHFSIVEVLSNALFSDTPPAQVERRYDAQDPIGKGLSEVVQRFIDYTTDSNLLDRPDFFSNMTFGLLDLLNAGMCCVRVRKLPIFGEAVVGQKPDGSPEMAEVLLRSEPVYEHVPFDRVLWPVKTRTWDKLPWLAFEHQFTEAELQKTFGRLDESALRQLVKSKCEDGSGEEVVKVYEFWHKESKTQTWVAEGMEKPLASEEDPYQLSGFFPTPEFLTLFRKRDMLEPIPVYKTYETQASKIALLSQRIDDVAEKLRVRGFYNAILGEDFQKFLEAPNATLTPSKNVLQPDQDISKMLTWFPVERLVNAMVQMISVRDEQLQRVYRTLGISDIAQGGGAASESARMSGLKDKYLSLRLKKWQKRVEKYVVSLFRLMAELGATLEPAELSQMTLIPQEVIAQLGQAVSDDAGRSFRIDVESQATVDAIATDERQQMSEAFNGLSQMLLALTPLIQNAQMDPNTAKALLAEFSRKYRFGRKFEQALEQMAGTPQQPKGEAEEEKALAAVKLETAQIEKAIKAEKLKQEQLITNTKELENAALRLQVR